MLQATALGARMCKAHSIYGGIAGVKENKPFGINDKIGYMFGDFGNDFTFILSRFF